MNNTLKHNWENMLKKKDKNLTDPGAKQSQISQFVTSWYVQHFIFFSPSVELQVPANWIDKLPSRGLVGLNHSVKGVSQGSAAVRARYLSERRS